VSKENKHLIAAVVLTLAGIGYLKAINFPFGYAIK
jgi:hypothetical protein